MLETKYPNHTWKDFVDDGLIGNARVACHEMSTLLPGMRGVTLPAVMDYVQNNDEDAQAFLDFFCSLVASVWRVNSVMAAQPYKTKYEHEAVLRSLQFSCQRFYHYQFFNQKIIKHLQTPPKTLSELRGQALGGVFLS